MKYTLPNEPAEGRFYYKRCGPAREVRFVCEAFDVVYYETFSLKTLVTVHQVSRQEWDEWALGATQIR